MSEDNYITIATKDQIKEKRVYCFQAGGLPVAICKVNEDYYAVHNKCSHANASFDNGHIRGYRLICPLHGAVFDVRNGGVLGAPALQPIKSYPIRINGKFIEICLDE